MNNRSAADVSLPIAHSKDFHDSIIHFRETLRVPREQCTKCSRMNNRGDADVPLPIAHSKSKGSPKHTAARRRRYRCTRTCSELGGADGFTQKLLEIRTFVRFACGPLPDHVWEIAAAMYHLVVLMVSQNGYPPPLSDCTKHHVNGKWIQSTT
jgi:hypothetical protein